MVVYFGLFQVSFQLLLAFKVVDDLKQKGNETKVDRYIAPGPVVWMHSTWTSSAGAQEKGNTGRNSVLPLKLVGKNYCSLGPSNFPFVKFSFPVTRLMPYYAETGRSRPPNRLTLRITLN